MKFNFFYFSIIGFYILQRIFELVLNSKNEKILIEKFHAVLANPVDSLRMKLLHVLWFIFLIFEGLYKHQLVHLKMMLPIITILIICQFIRFSTIHLLKEFWTINIFRMDKHLIVSSGIYQFIRHPNYLAVILELFLVPIIFKAYITAIIFSLLNLFILKKRIELEESILITQSDYQNKLGHLSKLIPFIY